MKYRGLSIQRRIEKTRTRIVSLATGTLFIKYNAEIYNGRKEVGFSVYRGATKYLLISWTNCNLNNAKMFQSVFLSFIETAVTLKHKTFLGVGTDLGVQDIYGVTVLVRAGRLGGEEVVELRLKAGVDRQGRMALHWAEYYEYHHLMEFCSTRE